MDNFKIDLTDVHHTMLESALKIAFEHAPKGQATHYSRSSAYGLVFYWHNEEQHDCHPLPVPMFASEAVAIVRSYLEQVDYPPEPDHDGNNKKGWRIYNEDWNSVGKSRRAIVAIQPAWGMYGK